MIVKTQLRNANNEVSFSDGIVVKFNSQCEAEVKDSIGEMLMEKYPKIVFKEFPEVEKPKLVSDDFNEKHIVQLGLDIIELKSQIASKERELGEAKAETTVWKNKTEELNGSLKTMTLENTNLKANDKKFKERHDLHVNLLMSNVASLQKTCEKTGFPKEEWERLGKEKLIEYMLQKS